MLPRMTATQGPEILISQIRSTCLREAATAKAGNAADGFFQPPPIIKQNTSQLRVAALEKEYAHSTTTVNSSILSSQKVDC